MTDKTDSDSTFVVLVDESDSPYAIVEAGENFIEAVKNYYDSLDAYCSSDFDDDHNEEFYVSVVKIPHHIDASEIERFRDLESDELAAEIIHLSKSDTRFKSVVVHVSFIGAVMQFK